MSELSMHELAAELGEVLPEREALSVGFAIGSFNHRTTVTNTTTHVTSVNATNASSAAVTNSAFSAANSSAGQTVIVHG
jgi:hypothetical protein